MQTATLHIKVRPDFARSLKKIAKKKGESVGEIVRQAVISSYHPEMLHMPIHQQRALEAYSAGFISIGKLSEIMGMDVMTIREWLNNHDVSQNTFYSKDDAFNA